MNYWVKSGKKQDDGKYLFLFILDGKNIAQLKLNE